MQKTFITLLLVSASMVSACSSNTDRPKPIPKPPSTVTPAPPVQEPQPSTNPTQPSPEPPEVLLPDPDTVIPEAPATPPIVEPTPTTTPSEPAATPPPVSAPVFEAAPLKRGGQARATLACADVWQRGTQIRVGDVVSVVAWGWYVYDVNVPPVKNTDVWTVLTQQGDFVTVIPSCLEGIAAKQE